MANELRELQLQGDSTVYKLNDARITTTAVPTATHILTTNSTVSSIAPITAANLASVLGDSLYIKCGIIEPGTQTIDCAGRFVFISVPGAISTILIYPQYASTEINLIGGNKTSYINYTKTANSRDVTFTSTVSSGVNYIIINLFHF